MRRRVCRRTADQVNYLVALANVRTRLGDYDGVGAVYEQALAIAVELEGPRSGLASRVLANYAIYAKRTGDFATARDLYERTLAIQVELYGEDNLSVARTHFNLGNLLAEMADYDAARAHYQQSLAIRERLLGPRKPRGGAHAVGAGPGGAGRGRPADRPGLCRTGGRHPARRAAAPASPAWRTGCRCWR